MVFACVLVISDAWLCSVVLGRRLPVATAVVLVATCDIVAYLVDCLAVCIVICLVLVNAIPLALDPAGVFCCIDDHQSRRAGYWAKAMVYVRRGIWVFTMQGRIQFPTEL